MDQHFEANQIADQALVLVLLCNCREVVQQGILRFRCVLRGGGRVEWEGDLDEHSRRELG